MMTSWDYYHDDKKVEHNLKSEKFYCKMSHMENCMSSIYKKKFTLEKSTFSVTCDALNNLV